ncbi:MAG TPA: hypothetical protein VGQ21_09805 [Thermoanaerobaculia bacterium]|nr:hypothetical protein [Thermoanaerobaculia bacterium]
MVNAVTREHGEMFADEWIERSWATGAITEACSETKIIEWPYEPDGGGDDLSVSLQNEIVQRVADQLRSSVVETFVRLANAVIERERTRVEESLIPARIEMVETVTPEQGLIFAEQIYREIADSEVFDVALSATHIRTFPDDGRDGEESAAQKHFHAMTDEIRDRIHDETKQLIADAFVRVVGDVISRERQRR